jgi:hypothetical protein
MSQAEHVAVARPLTANPALLAITITGLLLALLGLVLWVTGGNLLGKDQMTADYAHALGLDSGVNIAATSPQIEADHGLIGWGIALLVLGVLLLVVRLTIAAVRPREVSSS